MSYSYNFNYINLRNSTELEYYLYKNNIDILYSNYDGNILELSFNTSKTEQEITNINTLLDNYPNEIKEDTGDNFISIKNSTSTLLNSYGIFEGQYENISEYNCISIFCISNVNSLSEGLEFHFSTDGITSSYIKKISVVSNKPVIENLPVSTKYFKIIYKNNQNSQSSFNLNVIYFKNSPQFIKELQIKEETPSGPPTNGRFRIHGFEINAISNQSTIKDFSWKYPISALNIKFMTTIQNIGDILNAFIIPCINIAKLETAQSIGDTVLNISSTTIQNISVGYFVMIMDGTNTQDLGLVIAKNTESNQITVQSPLLTNFKDNANLIWKVPVGSSTSSISSGQHNISFGSNVISKISPGMCASIFNGSSLHNLGEITEIDIGTGIIEIENTPLVTFNSGSYLFVSVNNVKNMKLNKDDKYEIGGSKIGGSYLNAFYVVRLVYTNTKNEDVNFCWQTEYLY
jgi:hypothetical protein